jgi:formate dehydrogenase subunit gamma
MRNNPNDLRRYDDGTRMNHWAIVLLFICAALSGLAFFHPSMYFFTAFFGGGSWTRILHPYIGVAMFLCFLLMFVRLWKENVLNSADRAWLDKSGEMFRGNKDAMPPVSKYNAGQKIVFWLMAVSLLVLLATGILFWHAWFPDLPILARRIGVVLHALSAVVLVLTVIVHVYAAIWVKGTTRAMTRGTVSRGWARANHPLWHEEMTRGK